MDIFETIDKRRSVRKFKDKPIDANLLERILDAANQAPSAANLQAYGIVLVTRKESKEALALAAQNQMFLAEASAVLAFVTDPRRSSGLEGVAEQLQLAEEVALALRQRGENFLSIQDATVACAYAQLAATALGLATIWVGLFDPRVVHKILRLAPASEPAALLAVGHPAETPAPTPRRTIRDLVCWETHEGARFTPALDVRPKGEKQTELTETQVAPGKDSED